MLSKKKKKKKKKTQNKTKQKTNKKTKNKTEKQKKPSNKLRARSQIPVLGLTGRAHGCQAAASGAGFSGQNLGIKYIPCVGTHL